MSDKVQVSGGGVGFCGLLTLLFIALKLTGYISWSWFWVLSPLWIPFAVVLGIFGLIVATFVAAFLIGLLLAAVK